jgi:hypothetical protein
VAQSMAATCHMFIGLKSLHLARVDPVTSGQGKALGKAAQPVRLHVLLNICMCCNIFEFTNMCIGGVNRAGAKPQPTVIYMYCVRPVLWAVKPTVIYICCNHFDMRAV